MSARRHGRSGIRAVVALRSRRPATTGSDARPSVPRGAASCSPTRTTSPMTIVPAPSPVSDRVRPCAQLAEGADPGLRVRRRRGHEHRGAASSGFQPRAIKRRAISSRDRKPISTTIVAECGGRALEQRRPRALVVPGDGDEGRCGAAMRHRDAGQRGRGDRGADARHDLERDAGRGERQRLLAAAPEDERVARLEPHDPAPAARGANQQPVDRLLATSRCGRRACRRRTAARAARARARRARRARRTARGRRARAGRARGSVSSPGSPGPAPTSETKPALTATPPTRRSAARAARTARSARAAAAGGARAIGTCRSIQLRPDGPGFGHPSIEILRQDARRAPRAAGPRAPARGRWSKWRA